MQERITLYPLLLNVDTSMEALRGDPSQRYLSGIFVLEVTFDVLFLFRRF